MPTKKELFIQDIKDTIPYACGYWAHISFEENGDVNVFDFYEDENYTINAESIWAAISAIENGSDIEMNNTIRKDIVEDAQEKEMLLMDVISVDVVIQVAIYKQIVYG